jgi:hypothetical protein
MAGMTLLGRRLPYRKFNRRSFEEDFVSAASVSVWYRRGAKLPQRRRRRREEGGGGGGPRRI